MMSDDGGGGSPRSLPPNNKAQEYTNVRDIWKLADKIQSQHPKHN